MLTYEEHILYSRRNTVLKKLGFNSYAAYLESPLWQEIRQKVLIAHPKCTSCHRKATQVHHTQYEMADMDGTRFTHLLPVCFRCHNKCEFGKQGKLGPTRATTKLRGMQDKHDSKVKKLNQHAQWRYLFEAMAEARQYLGLDDSLQARDLCEKLDGAMAFLHL